MATTIPAEFPGIPSLSEAKVEVIKQWYLEALGDEDKADELETGVFYEGQRMAFESVLNLLFGITVEEPAPTTAGWDVIEGPIGLDGRSTAKGA